MPCESQEPSGPGPKTRPAVEEEEDEGRSAPASPADEAAAQTLPPATTAGETAVRLAGASERRERETHDRGVAGDERAATGPGIATFLGAAATRKGRERFMFDRSPFNVG